MKVVPLDEGLEKIFFNYVNRDPVRYYFFILDWKLLRDKAQILLAMEGQNIKGIMVVYRGHVVQLRGNREALGLLLGSLNLDKVELSGPLEFEDIICRKYRPLARAEVILMRLMRGDENIQMRHEPVRLTVADAEEVTELMRNTYPEWWGDRPVEMQKATMESALWLGIKHDGKIVSVGNTLLTDFGSNIGAIATHEQYRNKGFATSVVSALVKEILKKSSTALIHVLSDNAPAIRVYSKVGFKPYTRYLLIRGEKIQNP